jgi:hypothetical protein
MARRGDDAAEMPSFREECEQLAQLESFGPEAFRGTADVSQDLCNFVLALALVYNDCKDAIYANTVLAGSTPAGPPARTRAWGATAGAQFHTFRAIAGLLHELLRLIDDSKALLNDQFFVSVVKGLPAPSREAWQALGDVAGGIAPTNQLGKKLLLLRNKVFFHYDPKAIFAGYTRFFLESMRLQDRAYVSRGDTMRSTRLYFADAAAEGYLYHLVGSPAQANEFKADLRDVLDKVNNGLMVLVLNFIQRRGFIGQRLNHDRRDLRLRVLN